ncbi:hypothetical protein AO398_00395 [Methylobacterium sp. GXS13]|uniref:hypothetical protein n=1 Tax=Methylobacterium sp. GXS13 TaxID=1730094 RepID=UPI00071B4E1A|nr:hypothetical protein [Methylobacterium sp. GXS13]KST61184.1 hypothetical protein AO398_00395 [Methylobacterium sp. GXS13]
MRATIRRRVAPTPDNAALVRLEEQVAAAGSAKAFALKAGISESYVGDVRAGRRQPGLSLLLALGLVRVVSYAPAPEARS